MPVIRVDPSRLIKLIGRDLTIDELRSLLRKLKCDTDIDEYGKLVIEVQSDRPDMFSSEGIAYAIRLYLGLEEPRDLRVESYPFEVYNEQPITRPYVAVAAVTDVELNEIALEELIQFQEKLHVTYGRNRRKIAIGLHDLDKLPSNKIYYRLERIDKICFVPLHHNKEMCLNEVFEFVEQGRKYGSMSRHGDLHPVLYAGDEIISVPPVINADITKIDVRTRNIFIDVTGTDLSTVLKTLNILVHALAYYGGKVLGAKIVDPNGNTMLSPLLEWRRFEFDKEYVFRTLGIEALRDEELVSLLRKMGHKSTIENNRVVVYVPPYRVDVLHPIDIVEDVAIAIGYENIVPEFISTEMPKAPLQDVVLERHLRDVAVGLGYVEVNTFTLVPSYLQSTLGFSGFAVITNPISVELDSLRISLIPSIIQILKLSQHSTLPIKIFEIGEVVVPDRSSYTGWRNEKRLCMALMDSVIKFEDIHKDVHALLREVGLEPVYRRCSHPSLIEGRTACIYVDNDEIGVIGEVKPEILEKLEVRYPIALAELNFEKILKHVQTVIDRWKS